MSLEKQVSFGLCFFSFMLIWWNLFTPLNPDHVVNIFEDCLCVIFFWLSFMTSGKLLTIWLQLVPVALVAIFTASTDGGLFFSGVITVFFFVLLYAYGGFKTNALWKLPAAILSIFVLCAISSAHFTVPGIEAIGRAAMWSLLVIGFLAFLWRVVKELERQFYEDYATSLLEQNRKLLEINKTLSRGCDDGHNS